MDYFISAAGFIVKLNFYPTERVFQKNLLIKNIKTVWGRFLTKSSRKYDFEIRILSEEGGEVVVRDDGRKYYFLTLNRNFSKRRVTIYYSIGLPNLDLLLKEILAFLTARDGFLLHGSSLIDGTGNLLVFMAPSGGGKTTTAANLKDGNHQVFSDDIVIVRKLKGKWHFFSPPFIEKLNPPKSNKTTQATFFIVRKSKKASVNAVADKRKILPGILGQIWVREKMSKSILQNAIRFVNENDFYILSASLDKKAMKKAVYET